MYSCTSIPTFYKRHRTVRQLRSAWKLLIHMKVNVTGNCVKDFTITSPLLIWSPYCSNRGGAVARAGWQRRRCWSRPLKWPRTPATPCLRRRCEAATSPPRLPCIPPPQRCSSLSRYLSGTFFLLHYTAIYSSGCGGTEIRAGWRSQCCSPP